MSCLSSDGLWGWDECGRFVLGGVEDGGVRSVKGGVEEDRLWVLGVLDEGLMSMLFLEYVIL